VNVGLDYVMAVLRFRDFKVMSPETRDFKVIDIKRRQKSTRREYYIIITFRIGMDG